MNYLRLFLNQYNSECTQINYNRILTDFFNHTNKELTELTKLDVLEYVQQFKTQSTNTQALKISALKSFFKFLYENDILEKDLGVALKRPKISQKPKEALSKSEAMDILNTVSNPRSKAIIGVYLSTGIRVAELINLKLEDYINNPDKLTILTKGNKYRTICLNPTVQMLINKYLEVRKEGCDNLFVSNQGTPMRADKISQMLKRAAIKAGCDINISNHTFRSTFVTEVAMEHGILIAQQAVGHSNINTTKRYVRGIEEQVNNVMRNIDLAI